MFFFKSRAAANMEIYQSDSDLAFDLQMEEAMNNSLLQQSENDSETLKLKMKLEQEMKDTEQWEAEMNKLRHDLKLQAHDFKFAQEILNTPEKDWQRYGEILQKPVSLTSDDEPFKLYFKGMYNGSNNESVGKGKGLQVAAIGAAICDPHGNLILNIQKLLDGGWDQDCEEDDLQLKVEVEALMEGLNTALSLDLKNIEFFCQHYQLFQYITVKHPIKKREIGMAVNQLLFLQQQFDSCRPFFVSRSDVKFAFKLARDAIDSQFTNIAESSGARNLKETCSICLEDIDVGQIFAVDGCLHRYCRVCMKQHVEAKLLNGILPKCPFEGCKTQLDIQICRNFLPLELIEIMNKHMKESSIPTTEKLYCPYPTCSVLMSKSQILTQSNSVIGKCINCQGLFCVSCKVPWHNKMNCQEYKRSKSDADDEKLKSLAKEQSWRQCTKCNFMVELVDGCNHITCRCGYEFCYVCGTAWKRCACPL